MIHEYEVPYPDATFHSGLVKALKEGDLELARENLKSDILAYERELWRNYI